MYTKSTGLADTANTNEQKAVEIIWKRMNSIYGNTSKNDVLKIINRYVRRLVSSPNTPIYNTYYVETVPKPEYFQTATDVAQMAGVSVDLARKVLTQLEYADKDGSIPKGVYNPRVVVTQPKITAPTTNTSTNTPIPQVDYYPPPEEEAGNTMEYVKWGAIGVGAIGVGLFLAKKNKKKRK